MGYNLIALLLLMVRVRSYTQQAICVLQPTALATTPITGTVTFSNTTLSNPAFPITVTVQVMNLPAGAVLGFHVHQYGFIGKTDGSGAGLHFNPFNTPHAYPVQPNRHVGDLGNITVDTNGMSNEVVKNELLAMNGVASIIGRSVIIHAQADDGITQPTGNAGGRIAQCVIGIQQTADVNVAFNDQPTTWATAELRSSNSWQRFGRIIFTQLINDVLMSARICGFLPSTQHVISIAQSGDLTNITLPATTLTTVTADINGVIDVNVTGLASFISLSGNNSVVGRTILVFEGIDTSTISLYALAGVIGVASTYPGVSDLLCPIEVASCLLSSTAGNNVTGTLRFKHYVNDNSTVYVTGSISGFVPGSIHGMHIHQYGNIGTSDGMGTGGHYDPFQTGIHGLPYTDPRHIGDMGNLIADGNGNVAVNLFFNQSLLSGFTSQYSIIGRAVIVHEKADNGSQPVGFSGLRYSQCVIGVGNPSSTVLKSSAYASPATSNNNATCELNVVSSAIITGRFILSEMPTGGIRIQAVVCGLQAFQSYGLAIHEFGDLTGTPIDALIGDTYNPTSQPHGYPSVTNARHLGDLGNITSGSYNLTLDTTINLIALTGSNSMLGRTIAIHEFPDDGSQPNGSVGRALAVCVIGYVNTITLSDIVCAQQPTTASPVTTTIAPNTSVPTTTAIPSSSGLDGTQIAAIVLISFIVGVIFISGIAYAVYKAIARRIVINRVRRLNIQDLESEGNFSPYSPITANL